MNSFSLISMHVLSDACKDTACAKRSICINVPVAGATCRCSNPTHVIKNGQCSSPKGKLYKVSGLKLNQAYKNSYSNQQSAEFKEKAAEIENILYKVVCRKIFGCLSIRVESLKKGSIVVDYNVVMSEAATNVTIQTVLQVSQASVNDPEASILNPQTSSALKVVGELV